MIRRFSAILVGLALTLPLTLASVSAHTSAGVTVTQVDSWSVGTTTHVVGVVTNHTSSRVTNIQVTATWTSPASSETGPAYMSNLAPHASSPFHLVEDDVDVSAAAAPSVAATSSNTSTKPAGGLHLALDTDSIVGDVYTVNVTNDSASSGTGIVVYAYRDGTNSDAAASAPQTLAAGATAAFTVTFDDDSDGTDITAVIAKTSSGTFLTSWNNYFSDLGTTTFEAEIAYLADEGITLGCGDTNFCPKNGVTREQMAIFLDRALELPDDTDGHPFTDIGSRSPEAQQAIANLHQAGITGGCTADKFCPTQNVTRGQMSKFIVLGYELPAATGDFVDSFTDDDGHFSEPYNDAMKQAAITTGCGATTYCPESNVLRDQMAKFLYEAEN